MMRTEASYKVQFRTCRRGVNKAERPDDGRRAEPDTLARRLALAHHIERLIERGVLRDYAHAARVLGVTRARMTQIVDLALLPVSDQEAILSRS